MAAWEEFFESNFAFNDTSVHVSSAITEERGITFDYGCILLYNVKINE